jgi:predicted enzyme related to lactoylglutathione lyase
MTAHGGFHWNELNTRNLKKAKDFYGRTLGWSFEEMPMGEGASYTLIKANGEMVGGMMEMKGPMFEGVPENWFVYIAVDDIDKRLAKLKQAGGKVIREPWEAPGVGRIAIVEDVNGAVSGWMTPAPGSM